MIENLGITCKSDNSFQTCNFPIILACYAVVTLAVEMHNPSRMPIYITHNVATSHLLLRRPLVLNYRPTASVRHAQSAAQLGVDVSEVQLACHRLIDAGQAQGCFRLMEEFRNLTGSKVPDNDGQMIANIIQQLPVHAAIQALHHVRLQVRNIEVALQAFKQKKSARGIFELQRLLSKSTHLLRGEESRGLWLSFLSAYGALQSVSAADNAFRSMKRARAWRLHDTHAFNQFLNAIHTDLELTLTRARHFLDNNGAPDISTFNVLLKSCMKAKDIQTAELVLDWSKKAGVCPDHVTFNSLIRVYAYGGQFEKALGVVESMIAGGITPDADTYSSLILASGSVSQAETAEVIFAQAKEAGIDCRDIYLAMMTACNACHRGERSLQIFDEVARGEDYQPTTRAYNLALKACENPPGRSLPKDQFVLALELHAEMKSKGVTPDSYTYSTLLELCAQAGQGHSALQLAAEADARKIKMNIVHMCSLVKAFGATGMVREAMDVFAKIVWGANRLKPNQTFFKALIKVLRENDALSEALRVYEGMRRAGFSPNNREFQDLIGKAAEVALFDSDPHLQQQVAQLCGVTSSALVDLHRMSSFEARAAVLCVLSLVESESLQAPDLPRTQDLVVITGRGEHSIGEPVLRNVVTKLLTEELHMELELQSNEGRVIVPAQGLQKWLQARRQSRQTRGLAIDSVTNC